MNLESRTDLKICILVTTKIVQKYSKQIRVTNVTEITCRLPANLAQTDNKSRPYPAIVAIIKIIGLNEKDK